LPGHTRQSITGAINMPKKSEYRNKRPDSPKGLVFAAWQAKGDAAAIKLGEKLGIAPASRVSGWIRNGFQHVNDKAAANRAAKADEPKAKPKASPKSAKAAPKKAKAKTEKPTKKKKPSSKTAPAQQPAAAQAA
jgi:hypothetical protein